MLLLLLGRLLGREQWLGRIELGGKGFILLLETQPGPDGGVEGNVELLLDRGADEGHEASAQVTTHGDNVIPFHITRGVHDLRVIVGGN